MRKQIFVTLVLFAFYIQIFCDEKIDFEKVIQDLGSDQYEIRVKAKKILETAGLRVIPLLKKAIKSDDLEIKDYAENKVKSFFICLDNRFKGEKTLAVDARTYTAQKFNNEYYLWLKEIFFDTYEKYAIKDSKWDKQFKILLPMWLDYFSEIYLESKIIDNYHVGRSGRKNEMELRKLINEITANGCDDPLFLYLKNTLYYVWYDARNTPKESERIKDLILKSNYPHYFKFYTTIRTKWTKIQNAKASNKNEKLAESMEMLKFWTSMSGELPPSNKILQRRYVQWTNDFWFDLSSADIEGSLEQISLNLGKDSWVDHVLRGKLCLKKARDFREGNQASIGPNGLVESLDMILVSAESHYLKACQMNPELPEPFGDLLEIKMMSGKREPVRLLIDTGLQGEINNTTLIASYMWYLRPKNNGNQQDLLNFGREFLVIDNPKINMAQFYMSSLMNGITDGVEVFVFPGVLGEVEWAIEQQMAFKPLDSNLYYNDLVMAAFSVKDYQKTLKAIQDTKGFFSAGWYPFEWNSGFIENYAMLGEKYKNKPIGEALIALPNKNTHKEKDIVKVDYDDDGISEFVPINEAKQEKVSNKYENFNKILDRMNVDVEAFDRPKLISALMNLKYFGNGNITSPSLESFIEYGYREIYFYSSVFFSHTDEKLKAKLIELYGAKTLEALRFADSKGTTDYFQKEIAEKIKAIFAKDMPNEKELEKNDEYNKAQLRACSFNYNEGVRKQEQLERTIPYIKNLQNIGDACDFIFTYIYTGEHNEVKWGTLDAFQKSILFEADRNIGFIDQEIKRLSSVEDDKKLVEEMQKTWFAKGSPVLMLEIAKLLKQRNLLVDAEKVRAWSMFCLEGFNVGKGFDKEASEILLQTLSIYPGNDKEAYQMGLTAVRFLPNKANHYLMAYHILKLGNYQWAYELLCKGQTVREINYPVFFNKIKYEKTEDLWQAIASEMLATKELPENIRYNLKDQFDSKIKK